MGNRSPRGAWASLVLVLGITMIPAAFGMHSLREVGSNTEYVANVLEPLIAKPEIQDAIIDRAGQPFEDFISSDEVAQLIVDSVGIDIEVPTIVNEIVDAIIEPVRQHLISAVDSTIERIVTSDAFADQWRTMVADSHREFRQLLEQPPASPGATGELTLPVTSLLRVVQADLVDQGFGFLAKLDPPQVSVTLRVIEDVGTLQRTYQSFVAMDSGVAIAAIIALGVGLWFSPRRDIAFVVVGVGVPLGVFIPLWYAQSQVSSFEPLWRAVGEALLVRPTSQALTISVVTVAIAAVGAFAEWSRRRQPTIP